MVGDNDKNCVIVIVVFFGQGEEFTQRKIIEFNCIFLAGRFYSVKQRDATFGELERGMIGGCKED